MAPSLAITYSSDGGDGPLGRGFSLSGLSKITRCVKNLELDGEAHAVAYDDTDAYCLDGQRLVLVNDQGSTKEYRTIPDSHVRVISVHTGDTHGPTYFEVDEPSGIQKWYGKAFNSRVMGRNGYVAGWSLSAVNDRNMNGIQYTYFSELTSIQEPDGSGSSQTVVYTGQHRLESIQYTSPNPQRSVELEYDDMPVAHTFSGQMDFTRSARLKKISMFGPQHELVREYNLGYTGSDLPSSRLTDVQECADGWLGPWFDRRCLSPTRFEWSGGAAEEGFERVPTSIQIPDLGEWLLADVNGDGLDDIVESNGDIIVQFRVALGTGDPNRPFQDDASWFYMSSPAAFGYDMLPADLDNDGRVDIVLQNEYDDSPQVTWLRSTPASAQSPLPHFELMTTTIPRDPTDEVNQVLSGENDLKLGDFDGDGRIDVLRWSQQGIWVGTTSSWQPGDQFDLQLGDDLYVVDSKEVFYRNEGGGTFSAGTVAFGKGAKAVAPIFGDGKASVLLDGYGVVRGGLLGATIGPDAVAFGTYAALSYDGIGNLFSFVSTSLEVGADLPQADVDSVGWHDSEPFDQSRRPLIGDFNGDGVADVVSLQRELRTCADGEEGRKSKDSVQGQPSNDPACWSTRAVVSFGQSPLVSNPLGVRAATPLPAPRSIVKSLIDQALAFHYDDDALADALFPLHGSCLSDQEKTCYAVLRSTGDLAAPFEIISTDIPYRWEIWAGKYESPKAAAALPADTDGNGRADLVVLEPTNDLVVYRRPVPVSHVVRVIEGRNPRSEKDPSFVPSVEIEYGSLIDRQHTRADLVAFGDPNAANNQPGPNPEDLYQARWHSADCAWPVACVAGPRQVVSRYKITDGLEGQRTTAMLYRDARYDVAGHRFLGFGAVMRADLDTLSGSATFMNNEQYDAGLKVYPFSGVPSSTWEWRAPLPGQPNANQLELTFTGTVHALVPTVAGSYFRYPSVTRVWTDEAEYDPGNGIYGLLDKVAEESVSPTNVLTDRTHVIMDVDAFGNVLSEITKTEGIIGDESATHTYENDVASWILGRELDSDVCSSVDGVTQCRSRQQSYDDKGPLVHARVGDPGDLSTLLTTSYTRDSRGNVTGTVSLDGFPRTGKGAFPKRSSSFRARSPASSSIPTMSTDD